MAISASLVKELRERTGAGMMDCKKALQECDGDQEKSLLWLREKGLAKAQKKSGRATSQGFIGSYIHSNGKIGVMVELKCETDFVAKNEKFLELAKDLAMQVAATAPLCVAPEDIPEDVLERERQFVTQQTRDEGKPENIIPKIVDGRMKKFAQEVCLLEQAFIKDDSRKIKDLITETIAVLGENIQVGRVVRMALGEEA
ncbi:translation elongation factor Ts [Desulfonatronum lacustre]|uniref:translation elongation factor Ts n=1 Tax=Desulfonatronum lacustre TaxID=66849 RepID=UPI00048A8F0F|nr:translation elongation factor Ts [Desulfonatronum lacustre]SMP39939.1 elongation factor Ts [Desulfonatronum zhilinae]